MHNHTGLTKEERLAQDKQLEEEGIANIESLLEKWGVQYQLVNGSKHELDILGDKWRDDNTFGACRFNISDGVGADFAETPPSHDDLAQFQGMDASDFDIKLGKNKVSYFHFLGLVMRVHNATYGASRLILKKSLKELGEHRVKVSADAAEQRQQKAAWRKKEIEEFVARFWRSVESQPYIGTIGERYLFSRRIILADVEPDIKFHPSLRFLRLKNVHPPALVFGVRESPKSEVRATHRIYLKADGSDKADVPEPKLLLGSATGKGIWFGTPGPSLCVAEGPETALSLRVMGYPFVCCAVAAYNLKNLNVELLRQECGLREIIVCADNDEPGIAHAKQATQVYLEKGLDVKLLVPKEGNKDFNDVLKASLNQDLSNILE